MGKRKRRTMKKGGMKDVMEVTVAAVGMGITGSVIASSGVTGTARTLLDTAHTMQGLSILKKQSKKVL